MNQPLKSSRLKRQTGRLKRRRRQQQGEVHGEGGHLQLRFACCLEASCCTRTQFTQQHTARAAGTSIQHCQHTSYSTTTATTPTQAVGMQHFAASGYAHLPSPAPHAASKAVLLFPAEADRSLGADDERPESPELSSGMCCLWWC